MRIAFQYMSLDVVFEEVCIEKREGPRTEFWDISTCHRQEVREQAK